MPVSHCIAYLSPAGTTRLVAQTIAERLLQLDCRVEMLDLAGLTAPGLSAACTDLPERCCLWLGSPVYCDHAVPIVETFVRNLPDSCHGYSVPFVTWGGVTSGLALPELAGQLESRGFVCIGAAKVLAEHSSTWSASIPMAAGRPDAHDLQQLSSLVDRIVDKLKNEVPLRLAGEQLDYLSEAQRTASMGKSLALVKAALPPLEVDQALCSKCGLCAAQCPMKCIRLKPYPELGAECIRCLQCVRKCPEKAFLFDAEFLYARIVEMARMSSEEKVSAFFC